MKKYIATQCPIEGYDPEKYFNESCACYTHIWIGGNSDFKEYNKEIKENYIDGLQRLYDKLEEDRIEDNKEDLKETICESINNIKPYIEDYCDYIKDLAYEYGCSKNEYKLESVCKLLKLIYKKDFEYKEIKGSCQGEWNYIIYPKIGEDMIDWIESVYFGLGSEFAISIDKVDEDEDPLKVSYYYVWQNDIEDIREELAKRLKCNKDEILIRRIKDRYINYNYEYETL